MRFSSGMNTCKGGTKVGEGQALDVRERQLVLPASTRPVPLQQRQWSLNRSDCSATRSHRTSARWSSTALSPSSTVWLARLSSSSSTQAPLRTAASSGPSALQPEGGAQECVLSMETDRRRRRPASAGRH